jgi:uncharacterized protein with PIN domain
MEKEKKFLIDINLGRLVIWLRILGYDTILYRGRADRNFLRKAQEDNRTVLTRRRDLAKRQFQGMLLLIESDRVEKQVEEVFGKLGLEVSPDLYFSRCLRCNVLLKEVEKETIQERVPPYVFEHHSRFMTCPGCGAVYWPGTHSENIRDRIKALRIPSRRL